MTALEGRIMVTFDKDRWKAWAREWGLTHHPQKGLFRRTEHVDGARHGLLLQAGWGTSEYPGLTVLVRFPRSLDTQGLRQRLIDDTTLDALPGKGGARRRMAVVTVHPPASVRWGKPPEFQLTE